MRGSFRAIAAGAVCAILMLAGCSGQQSADTSAPPTPQDTASDGTVFTGTFAQDYRQAYDSATEEDTRAILRDGDLSDITSLEGPVVNCVSGILEAKYGAAYSGAAPIGFSTSNGGLEILQGTPLASAESYDPSSTAVPDTQENRDIKEAIETCDAQYSVTALSDLAIKSHHSVQ